ncbi:MAG: 4-(cytidine 5'-diphospho)-2-C-methyl-D-erythritol kinase [Acidobacteriota bacterium]|nr:4-(cytidine 5'-diphospho)-2-C-methyl-D-erythritol kinase [Acidobacteriota bacterium]
MRLRALAPAKVNLSLFLGGTRPEDGRHRLVTVFESLSLADTLELELIEGAGDEVVCPGVEGENLAARALAGLRARGWDGPRVRITIAKRIPVAAGMAGGSADAAATLRLAMAVAPGRAEEIDQIAAELGADVPSQLLPGVALGTGAGEIVEHFAPLAEHAFVVLPSELQLATPDVFREADRLGLPRSDQELDVLYGELVATLAPDAGLPARLLVNDLEAAAVSLCPWCGEALAAMRAAGAEHALVSGSGPTVVGIWWGLGAVGRAFAAAQELRLRYPLALAAEPVSAEYAAASLT